MPKPDKGQQLRLDRLDSEIARRGQFETGPVQVSCCGALADGAANGAADEKDMARDKSAGTLKLAASSGRQVEKGFTKEELNYAGSGHSPGLQLNGWQSRAAQKSRVAQQLEIQAALRDQVAHQQVRSLAQSRGTAYLYEGDVGSSSHWGSLSSFGDDGDLRHGNHVTLNRLLRARRALNSGGCGGNAKGPETGCSFEVQGAITTAELQEAITAAAERLR